MDRQDNLMHGMHLNTFYVGYDQREFSVSFSSKKSAYVTRYCSIELAAKCSNHRSYRVLTSTWTTASQLICLLGDWDFFMILLTVGLSFLQEIIFMH